MTAEIKTKVLLARNARGWQRRIWWAQLLLPPLVGFTLFYLFSGEPGDPWTPPDFSHPLGTDEFARDVLATALAATGLSLLKGMAMTAATLIVAIVCAELATLRSSSAFSFIVRAAASIIESVPVVLWVLIVLIVVTGPRLVVVGAAFTLVLLPIATHLLSGEFLRLREALYVEAAYLLGASELRVLARYILPNATAVLLPFAVQVLGTAIAVDGAIGVIGLGNRSDLDLGILLLRGKESFFLHPQILGVALLMYALVYGYLVWAGALLSRRMERSATDVPTRAGPEASQL